MHHCLILGGLPLTRPPALSVSVFWGLPLSAGPPRIERGVWGPAASRDQVLAKYVIQDSLTVFAEDFAARAFLNRPLRVPGEGLDENRWCWAGSGPALGESSTLYYTGISNKRFKSLSGHLRPPPVQIYGRSI